MTTTVELSTIADSLRDVAFADDMSGRGAFEAMRTILTLRNLIDHHAAILTGHLERLGVGESHGRKLRELLIVMGFAPNVAARLIRIAASTAALPTAHAHAADGAISAEHIDAIVTGIAHIAKRSPESVDDDTRYGQLTDLLGQFFFGATPAQIAARARVIGNELAATTDGGLPAAEDRSINALTHAADSDGRLQVRADLDTEVGEKFRAAMEELGAPRPEPDGSADARSIERRQADALETLLDIASRGGDTASAPRTQVLITVPADAPIQASLQFMGSVTEATLAQLTCDASVTTVIVDGEKVPLDISRDKRLFTAAMRKALYVRDRCCIKCGAPAARTHAHHIVHWADGGETAVVNGCLLCPSCHADVHHNGWDVTIGLDKHPWLIPPATLDPRRQPIPAHNRRSMTLDDLPAAA
ncbi:HNH endonuclease [Gordonia hankookensis]|uniref:DUF222 domain-containing protein n=1 Tax=Gordonia hankookensis TaxID=589403 RepID=A0ABR7WG26_9ACTN|nr:HNH endonuclease signature motif containing protein [Gordonia hankookensis]MBD1321511.1 DUF222 domain-containing protein [Gordonia hankookensis]